MAAGVRIPQDGLDAFGVGDELLTRQMLIQLPRRDQLDISRCLFALDRADQVLPSDLAPGHGRGRAGVGRDGSVGAGPVAGSRPAPAQVQGFRGTGRSRLGGVRVPG
jgi:hypothetical protein